jgi:hypothetical protein
MNLILLSCWFWNKKKTVLVVFVIKKSDEVKEKLVESIAIALNL